LNTKLLQQNQKTIAVCITFFIAFVLFSIFKTNLQPTDTAVNLWIVTIHTDTTTLLAKGIHIAFDTITIAIASIAVASFIFIKGCKIQSLLLVAAISGDALFIVAIKTITQVARPENQIVNDNSFSYPSGHCAGAIIFIGLITYYIWLKWNNSQRTKILSATIFGLVIALVGFDRIYLNVHWLSDVIGGCLLGAFWLSFCIITYEYLKRRCHKNGGCGRQHCQSVSSLIFALTNHFRSLKLKFT
jgi:undecaprenyl-diphosphatase